MYTTKEMIIFVIIAVMDILFMVYAPLLFVIALFVELIVLAGLSANATCENKEDEKRKIEEKFSSLQKEIKKLKK